MFQYFKSFYHLDYLDNCLYRYFHIHILANAYFGFLQVLFTNPSARAGYDTRSILKQSLTGLNSEFSFS